MMKTIGTAQVSLYGNLTMAEMDDLDMTFSLNMTFQARSLGNGIIHFSHTKTKYTIYNTIHTSLHHTTPQWTSEHLKWVIRDSMTNDEWSNIWHETMLHTATAVSYLNPTLNLVLELWAMSSNRTTIQNKEQGRYCLLLYNINWMSNVKKLQLVLFISTVPFTKNPISCINPISSCSDFESRDATIVVN